MHPHKAKFPPPPPSSKILKQTTSTKNFLVPLLMIRSTFRTTNGILIDQQKIESITITKHQHDKRLSLLPFG